MEATGSYDGSYNSTTNWRIGAGSLADSITFESSFSSATADDDNNDGESDATAKSPLVLRPASPDPDPCEITIIFAQEHEVRQVYVRSTARVYEIYYASEPQQSNEYLCTVRCGVAARDDEVLQVPGVEEASLAHSREPIKDLDDRRIEDNGNGRTNEDDWVEVKPSDASLLNNGKNPPVKPQGRAQDFYEATAEINDSEPCISITLRLLSLQDKGCLVIDEVYIFADPVDPTNSDAQVSRPENSSAGSSLMAMFMPTLLQLSRARDVSHITDKQASGATEKKIQETWRTTNESAEFVTEIQQDRKFNTDEKQEVDLLEVAGTLPLSTKLQTLPQAAGTESKPDSLCNHVESVLHQLVTRVSRIEDMLTSFEKNMLKPINSIDARLQLVEQKVEELAKKSQNFELPTCTRVSAPEFPSSDTDFSSPYASESRLCDIESSEHNGEDYSMSNASIAVVDTKSNSHPSSGDEANAPHPEAANSNHKAENHSPVTDCHEEKPKRSVSINDALASALTGFLSSTLAEDRKYSRALVVKAPEFSNEEDGDTEKKAPAETHSGENTNLSSSSGATEITIKDSVSSSSGMSSEEREAEVISSIKDICEQMIQAVYDQFQDSGGGDNGASTTAMDGNVILVEHDVAEADSDDITIENSVLDQTDDPDLCTGNPTDDVSNTLLKGVAEDEEEPEIDILHNVLGFSRPSSVDFEAPILDVKFDSHQTSNNRSPILALLGGLPESNAEPVCSAECIDDTSQTVGDGELTGPPTDTLFSLDPNYYDVSNPEPVCSAECIEDTIQRNLISVGDGELTGPPTDTLFSVDPNYYDISNTYLNLKGEEQRDYHKSNDEEMPATSLI